MTGGLPARPGVRTRRNARYTPLDADGPLPLDMVRAVPAIRRDPLAFLEAVVQRHGDVVAFPLPRTPVLLVNRPDGARRVLQDNHRGYDKQTVQYRSLSLVTGSGLLTADGDAWRTRRRVVQPAFHHGELHRVATAAAGAADVLRREWLAAEGGVLDVDAAAMRATLGIVGATLFEDDLAGDGRRVVSAVDAALEIVVARARSPLPAWAPLPSRARLRRSVRTLDEVCLDLVRRRRARGVGPDDDDLLALLLGAGGDGAGGDGAGGDGAGGDPVLTDAEVRDELVTLVIAGHETVASCLTWTLQLLAEHPPEQERLADELAAVLGPEGRVPRWADLPGLRRTRAVVDEALRLYPPAWVVTRRANRPDRVAGVDVSEGTLVILSPWLLQRRAASWPDPGRFDPDRFLTPAGGGPSAGHEATRAGAYLPFGAGPRLCIGRDFALVETVLVLAGLLHGARVERPPGAVAPRMDALVTLRPHGGLPLRLRLR